MRAPSPWQAFRNSCSAGESALLPTRHYGVPEIAGKLPGAHAEVTAIETARRLGATPQSMAVTRAICPQCAAAIEASGGTVTSPTTAVWWLK